MKTTTLNLIGEKTLDFITIMESVMSVLLQFSVLVLLLDIINEQDHC